MAQIFCNYMLVPSSKPYIEWEPALVNLIASSTLGECEGKYDNSIFKAK